MNPAARLGEAIASLGIEEATRRIGLPDVSGLEGPMVQTTTSHETLTVVCSCGARFPSVRTRRRTETLIAILTRDSWSRMVCGACARALADAVLAATAYLRP